MATWTCVVPQLPVRDVPAAQVWYRDVLGLATNWIWSDDFGSVGEDAVELYLYRHPDPHPVYVSLYVHDVDAMHDACRERGAEIASELEDKPWNVREFTLRDRDGHLLRIGTEIEADEVPPELRLGQEVEAA
jgi:catechol 2,3-dioxygenase-like lactoylglutathione lyase family enzyme